MIDSEETAAATLRRLHTFLDEPDDELDDVPFPTDAEARAIVAEMAIDVEAVVARVLARIDAFLASVDADAGATGARPLPDRGVGKKR